MQSLEHGTECPGASVMWLVERIFFAEHVSCHALNKFFFGGRPWRIREILP